MTQEVMNEDLLMTWELNERKQVELKWYGSIAIPGKKIPTTIAGILIG
jgi:hypothetical protein